MSEETRRRKPPVLPGSHAPDRRILTPDSTSPISLQEVNEWEAFWQHLLIRVLLPVDTLVRHGVDPISLTDAAGAAVGGVISGDRGHSFRLEVRHAATAQDPMLEMELADTSFNQIEVVWIAVQDPFSPRFDVDIMPDGESTFRGYLQRNIPAEEAAVAAGLGPGQTRRGLGIFTLLAAHMESFMACLNQREYIAQPLFYHTAVLFEGIGFTYMYGQALMERIARGFAPDGDLRARMDGSTPFRAPGLANSIRGRSWAVHDGILDEPWDRVRMVKRLGVNAEINTTPGVPY